MPHTSLLPLPNGWLCPEPLPQGVRALFTTRLGGVSAAPFDSFNLGDHVGDAPRSVAQNRHRLSEALRLHGAQAPVFLKQVHGTEVLTLGSQPPSHAVADACVTDQTGVVCTIMVADCLPVLFADRAGRCVAAAHAGWRGLAGVDHGGVGVLESTWAAWLQTMRRHHPDCSDAVLAQQTWVWLGPCIGPQAFEVGEEVRVACRSAATPHSDGCFVPHAQRAGQWWADLAGLARQRLAALGVTGVQGNDSSAAWCTVTDASRFFSHRRDARVLGGSGRMAACVWLV
ncbi:MAG: peptidoglycan editing factor PgeF [Pseudomonadota bacterium]|jgi:YfiH family protein